MPPDRQDVGEFRISSLEDPRLEPFRHLKRTNTTRWSPHFIAEGIRVVERLLAGDFPVASVLVSEPYRHRFPADLGERTTVLTIPQPLVELLVGYQFHAGVLACGLHKPETSLDDWLNLQAPPALLVACPRITDPENLGTIIRLGAGFGAGGLMVGRKSTAPFSRRSIRVSMGHVFALPIRQPVDDLAELRSLRRDYGYEIVAVELTPDAIPLKYFRPGPRTCLLFGNESDGLSPEYLAAADRTVMIPMHGQVDSLNVAISAAIVLNHCAEFSDSAPTDRSHER